MKQIKSKKLIKKLILKDLLYPFSYDYEKKINLFSALIDSLNKREDLDWTFSLFKTYKTIKFSVFYYFKIELILHFKELKIEVNPKLSHKIKDFFVILTIEEKSDYLIFKKIEGFRTTFTKEEYLQGFIHSHIRRIPSLKRLGYSPFCLGEQKDIFSFLNTSLYRKNKDFLLTQIIYFLKTESFIGIPYFRIANIKYYKEKEIENFETVTVDYLKKFKKLNKELLKNLKDNIIWNIPTIRFKEEFLEKIKNYILESKNQNLYILLINKDNKSLNFREPYSKDFKKRFVKISNPFYFNNKKIDKVKILNSEIVYKNKKYFENLKITEKDNYKINPTYIKKIENLITYNIIKEITDER